MMEAVPDGKIEVVRFIQGLTAERPDLLRPLKVVDPGRSC